MAAARETEPAAAPDSRHIDALAKALVQGALPGETVGFDKAGRRAAAKLALTALAARRGTAPSIQVESGSDDNGRRMLRLAIANDDMPFLVDSVANAVSARGLAIDRILHPIVLVERDDEGRFTGFGTKGAPTSLIYLETERADARLRKELSESVAEALDHVRRAVTDWGPMKAVLGGDADASGDAEGAALMRWLLDRNFTQLGSARYDRKGGIGNALGIAAVLGDVILAPEQREKARRLLEKSSGPILAKSNLLSTVHRRAPLDLLLVKTAEGIAIHAGLWTSSALAAAPDAIPVLRERLRALMTKYGFAQDGHAGKALAHALTDLPHDLLLAIDTATLERLALTAMSLADRPRAELVLTRDALDRHMFAFVWLPRDDITTARRVAISELIADAVDGVLLSWSIDMGGDEVALIRYTFDRRQSAGREPEEAKLRGAIVAMVRGWCDAVEASLVAAGESAAAARLTLRYAEGFPTAYRAGAGPDEAVRDILRLARLVAPTDRQVRLYRISEDPVTQLSLKLYSRAAVTLSSVVPALENFGFAVVEEVTTMVAGGGQIHRFVLDLVTGDAAALIERATIVEDAIASVLEGAAENDRFNELVVTAAFEPRATVLLRALFRYLRQTGLTYGLITVVDALRRHPHIARAIVELFSALHDPAAKKRDDAAGSAEAAIERALAQVAAIDDDRVLKLLRAVVRATLRTNFYAPAGQTAIAFKFDSASVPNLPAPVPWREIWVYSPRVEGIHLRAGPVARGGLRWSDRRDDFRTEVLGLMKAQRVKNAVIVPTGAKGGFFPKMLPDPATDRDALLAEGTESYKIFIRALLSVTDNIVGGKVVHPRQVIIRDDDDPYFVVAADKGTATFSDTANAIALDHNFWLGDAFASGGSVGYDHKAMGITAKGAWISVQRHFAELGVDVQTQPIRVVGCGDMSGDVFGNGMLLSKTLKIVAAFDHRHIFIDPEPNPAASWDERARLFALPRSSWADYNAALISKGGGVFARSAKSIKLSKQARASLAIDAAELEPAALISAILKSPVDLIWFGGIGTYVKAASETHGQVGDPANDLLRVDAEQIVARAIGEGANLGVTQAARIAFSLRGGRINTDFIDNSAGVDCSDNEVNIKIALNAEMAAGALTMRKRNALLVRMTDEVADLVLEDNRLQTLALSIAERGGANIVPSLVRLIETFEASGLLNRTVEGLPLNDVLARRAQDGSGLTRPELAVVLATAKLALQDAIELSGLGLDPAMIPELRCAFPSRMVKDHGGAIERHQLRGEIVATKVANRIVNRMGLIHPFELAEEEGASLGDVATAFVIAEALFDVGALWEAIDAVEVSEDARLLLFEQVAVELRAMMADVMRGSVAGRGIGETVTALAPGIALLDASVDALLLDESRAQARGFATRLTDAGAPPRLVDRVVRLAELDGAVGLSALSERSGTDPIVLTHAFTALGAALGLDWAQGAAMRSSPTDPWERLLVAGLSRDFQQMRLEWLARDASAPEARVDAWLATHAHRIRDFRTLLDRARAATLPSPAMLAQIAGQARVLLGR